MKAAGPVPSRGGGVLALPLALLHLFAFALSSVAAGAPLPAQEAGTTNESSVFHRIATMTKQLTEITGLEPKREVEYAVIPRPQLKEFLEQRIREEIKPEEIRVEELLLKKFGFVPADFRLKDTMVALYTEQAAAFYDFRKKKLFLLDSDEGMMQEAALFHELAHALADQHFRLERFLDNAGKNDDGALARMAVMEGQATWLMSEFLMRRTGQSLRSSPEMVKAMSRMIGSSGGQFPVFDNVPLYIRQSLIFPYTSGMEFQHALIERFGNRAFSEVFRKPPATTREVLHPGTYTGAPPPPAPPLPALANERHYERLAVGTMGEFDYAVLVQHYLDEDMVRQIAPSWRGGAYRFWEHKKDKDTILIHVSEWDTPEAADRFFQAYRKVIDGRNRNAAFQEGSPDAYQGRADDGYFAVRRAGKRVYCAEGLRASDQVKWPQR